MLGPLQPNVKLGELLSCGDGCLFPTALQRERFKEFSEAELLKAGLGGLAVLVLLFLRLAARPLLFLTCFRMDARRFIRLLCSDKTNRGHGLHCAISSAAIATARPTCSYTSGVYFGGKVGGGGGVARPLS